MESELTKFLGDRETVYRHLEDLLKRAEHGGLKKFTRDDLVEFGHIYRLAAADLARARYILRSPLLAEYLNDLVGRAHHLIHRKRSNLVQGFARFIRRDFPATVRKEIRVIMVALIIFTSSILIGGFSYLIDPEWGQIVWDQPMLRAYERAVESEHETLLATAIEEESMAAMSAFIITNNIRACIVASAGGILFGLGSLWALSFNGFLLGVVGVMFLSRGPEHNIYFWSGILPHGVLELPAICIAGAAGFLFAKAMLVPGRLSRGESLRLAGKNAVKLLAGVFTLLVIAGLIEGFITPMDTKYFPEGAKIVFSFILLGGFIWYLLKAGWREEESMPEPWVDRTTTHLRLE
jgi:uncharacterized membrane protein SpoIIM required for sporulation